MRIAREQGSRAASQAPRAVVGALAGLLAVTFPEGARAVPAQQRPLSEVLEVTSLNPCIERTSLADAVTEWLERETVDARLRVRVSAARETTFSIQLGDQVPLVRGFADLPGDCASQESAVALSIALAIDAVAPSPERRSREWRLGGDLVVTTPFPDAAALGGGLWLARHAAGALWLEAGAVAAIATDQALRDDLPVRFDAGVLAGRAGACGHLSLGAVLEGRSCVGPWVGATITDGSGLTDGRTESELWLALAASLGLHVAVTPGVGVQVTADLVAPLRPGTIRAVADGDEIRRDLPGLLAAFRVGPTASF